MKIDIGCGYKQIPGFIRVDGDINCKPDFLVNLETDRLPFEDNSVQEVRATHILEHIGAGFFHLLKEIYRVCEDGAFVYIEVPHFNHDIFKIDPTHVRALTVETFRMFSKKYNLHIIETQGTTSTLAIMHNVDFEVIKNEYVIDPFYDSIFPTLTEMEYTRLGREGNNVCLEEKILLQVIKD